MATDCLLITLHDIGRKLLKVEGDRQPSVKWRPEVSALLRFCLEFGPVFHATAGILDSAGDGQRCTDSSGFLCKHMQINAFME